MTRFNPLMRLVAGCAFLALAACAAEPDTPAGSRPAEPEASTGLATKATMVAERQMVAAANPLAARSGLDILRAGGNAVDAAIAVQMVLTLVEPQSSGIGGGAFLLHLDADDGRVTAYDGREQAPAGVSETMFLRPDGEPMDFYEAVVGGLSVGVPGVLRMLEAAHQDHGRLPWKDLFEPAIRMAEAGFAISPRLHGLVARDKYLKTFAEARAYFYRADLSAKPVGTILVNRPLAATLRAIAETGADAFYVGDIARDIVDTVAGTSRNPGRLSMGDMAAYHAVRRQPVCGPYRAWKVCGMPPPTSGGLATLQILGMLEVFDLPSMGPDSPLAAHLIAEASRLAFADRAAYVGDPGFVRVPVAGMLDQEYLRKRALTISAARSMGRAKPGRPRGWQRAEMSDDPDHGISTSHISIVDADGNAVSMTTSIENVFGSRVMVRGFMLNNQLTDFAFRPGKTVAVANRAQPGKRPRSSMSPTLVFDGDGKLVMAVGSPGGSRIIGYVVQTIIGVLDWKMAMQAAIAMPHVVNRNGPTDLEQDTPIAGLKADLEGLGHKVRVLPMTSGLHGIRITEAGLEGGADPRREGVAVGD